MKNDNEQTSLLTPYDNILNKSGLKVRSMDHSTRIHKKLNIKSNPNNHRNISNFSAYFHVVCSIAGPSILGLPISMKQGGWISVILIAISAVMSFYTGILIIECLYYKKERLKTYAEISIQSFGVGFKWAVQFFQFSIVLGTVCLFIIFISTNCLIINQFYNPDTKLTLNMWMIMASLLVGLPYAVLKSIKEITFMSIFGVLATFITVVFVVVYSLTLMPSQPQTNTDVINWKGIPLALSTISFAFGGSVVFPHIEGSMKTPGKWKSICFMAFLSVLAIGLLICVTGYVVYGNDIQSPIFGNLPNDIFTHISIILIIAHVAFAAPVYLCSFGLEMEEYLNINEEKIGKTNEFIFRFLTRISTVITLALIASAIPYFDAVIALLGSISDSFIMFIIPIVCHLKLFGIKNRPYWQYFVFSVILFFGIASFILGTYESILNLIEKMAQDKI